MMKQINLQWDTTSVATLSNTADYNAFSVVCEVLPENISEFTTANQTKFVNSTSRYFLKLSLSVENFETDDAAHVWVGDFISAPVRRIKYITSVTFPNIQGYTEFNTDNLINLNVDDYKINWQPNKSLRSIDMVLSSESTYTI